MERIRFTHIDLIRGICAITVLFTHFAFFAHADESLMGLPAHPAFFRLLAPLYLYGTLAVRMFWALSGFVFLIAYIGEGGRVSVRRFTAWRFSRLYPLHFATFLLVVIIQMASQSLLGETQVYHENDLINALYHLAFVSGWLGASQHSFNAVIWSVSVEAVVYVMFLIYLKAMRPSILVSLAIALAAALGSDATGNQILSCASFFFVGCAAASATLNLRKRSGLSHLAALAGMLLMSAALAVVMHHSQHNALAQVPHEYAVFASVPMLCGFADIRMSAVPRRFRWIGDTTYSVYLLHMPVMMIMLVVAKLAGWSEAFVQGPIILAAYISAVLSLSWIAYRCFEKPAQDWLRKRLVPDRKEPAADEMELVI